MRGFVALPVIIGLVVLGLLGTGVFVYSQQKSEPVVESSPMPTPTESPTPTPSPTATASATLTPKPKSTILPTERSTLVDCVGPDGKHVKLSQKDCDAFKKAWATPTPKPTPTPGQQASSGSCPGAGNGNLTVNITPSSGTFVGDAGVTMRNGTGSCPGVDSRLPYTQIARQGTPSVTYGVYPTGRYKVEVFYHGRTQSFGVTIDLGDNSLNVTVDD